MIASSYQVGGIDLGFGFQLGCWDLGLIGAYSRSSAKTYNKRCEGTADNYYGGIIARYYHPIATITMEGLGGCNKLDLKQKTDGAVVNTASPNGKSMLLEAKIALNYGNTVQARPIFGARYIWEDVPSYTEELTTLKKEYSGFKQDFAEGMVGILLFMDRNVSGVTIQPHLRALWIEEFLSKDENITVQRVATPLSQKTERVAFGERGYLQLTGGLSVILSNCLDFDVTGETNFFQREAPTADVRGRISYSF